jgi:serine protease AprX
VTNSYRKWTWLAATLALTLAWGVPAEAGAGGKKDAALAKALASGTAGGEIRVIVETVDRGPADAAIRASGGKAGRKLFSFPGQVVTVTAKELEKLERHPQVKAVYLDRGIVPTLDLTNITTGATISRILHGYTGAGIGVAVIDSGITSWHDDLTVSGGSGQRVTGFVDFVNGRTAPYDDLGHGTHVAGIVAGNGYDTYGMRTGVAPKASVFALKVLDGNGGGYMSNVIAAIDYALANRVAHNIRVINLSVGAAVTTSYNADPLTLAAKLAVEQGIVVVTAAGNNGKNALGQIQYGGITAPGNAPWVITVGNASHQGTIARWDDVIAPTSSRGPTAVDFGAKPDLVAPGTGIVSLSDPTSAFYTSHAYALKSGYRSTSYKPYLALTGTSMAAPVVAGTVAMMLEANPGLTPNAVKAILQFTAESKPDVHPLEQGAGHLNAYGAVTLAKYFAQPAGTPYPSSLTWSRQIIWGNYRLSGGAITPDANAWATNVVWGTAFDAAGDNIVWGTFSRDGDNIVWGTAASDNIVWGTSRDGDNIVWGTLRQGDNIVWGTASGDNIVWGTYSGDNIVWGTYSGDNIVWGTYSGDNIVWGTDCGGGDCDGIVWGTYAGDGDNIVWGTAEGMDNIVWGTSGGVDNVVWGTSSDDNIVWGTAADDDNIVWGTSDGDNIVWGTAFDGDNIVWGTSDGDNIVWGTTDGDNIVWGTAATWAYDESGFEALFALLTATTTSDTTITSDTTATLDTTTSDTTTTDTTTSDATTTDTTTTETTTTVEGTTETLDDAATSTDGTIGEVL